MLNSIFEAALRSFMLAVAVWGGLRAFRVHNVVYQRLAWAAVLAGALLMPGALSFTSQWHVLSFTLIPTPAPITRLQTALTPPQPTRTVKIAPATTTERDSSPNYKFITPLEAVAETRPSSIRPDVYTTDRAQALTREASQSPAVPLRISLVRALVLAYCLVAAGLFARLALGLIAAMRLWHSAEPISLDDIARHDLDPRLTLRTSDKISAPVTIGSGILLPDDYTTWTDEKLRIVLAHERSHVVQRDFHLLMLASLYTAVTWFSPLGWWLKHKLSDLGEAISDRSGLNAAPNRSAYAQILLEFAASPRPTLIGVAMARPSNISRRIERLLNDSYLRHAFSANGRARAAVLLVPVFLFAASALVHVQAATQAAPAPKAPGLVAPAAPAPPAPSAPEAPSTLGSSPASVAPAAPRTASEFAPPAPPSPDAISPTPPDSAFLLPPPPPGKATFAAPPAPPAARSGEGDNNEKFKGEFDRTLSVGGKVDLSLSTGSGTIVLKEGSSNQVHIHGVVKVYQDGDVSRGQQLVANPPIVQNGNTIRVGVEHENLRNIGIDLVVEAPADAALNASTGSGDIKDTGVGQGARMSTGSGDIEATGLEGGFKLETGSGEIKVDGSGQGDVKVQTGSGGIDVKGVHGGLDAQTGSGDLKIEGSPSSTWKLQTGSGSVELSTGNAPMNLDASTGSGNIVTKAAGEMRTDEEHHHVHLQLNGGGPEVRVVTGSGDIQVR